MPGATTAGWSESGATALEDEKNIVDARARQVADRLALLY
jgi:hypothetical protein